MTSRPSLSPGAVRVDLGDHPRRPDTVSGPDAALRRMSLQSRQFQTDLKTRPQPVAISSSIKQHQSPDQARDLLARASQYVSRGETDPKLFGRAGVVAVMPMVGNDRDGTSRRLDALSAGQMREWAKDPRHWHIVISPEARASDAQLVRIVRDAMEKLGRDLGAALDWKAVAHHNTAHPHVHVLLRGVDRETGKQLFVQPQHLTATRQAAMTTATRLLGPAAEKAAEQARSTPAVQRGRGVER